MSDFAPPAGQPCEEGEIYWCIRPSIELLDYDLEAPAREPWRGRLERTSTGALKLVYLCKDGSEDRDTNACSFVLEGGDLFTTYGDARMAYERALVQACMNAAEELERRRTRLDKFRAAKSKEQADGADQAQD